MLGLGSHVQCLNGLSCALLGLVLKVEKLLANGYSEDDEQQVQDER